MCWRNLILCCILNALIAYGVSYCCRLVSKANVRIIFKHNLHLTLYFFLQTGRASFDSMTKNCIVSLMSVVLVLKHLCQTPILHVYVVQFKSLWIRLRTKMTMFLPATSDLRNRSVIFFVLFSPSPKS